jgi:hypothetical protein
MKEKNTKRGQGRPMAQIVGIHVVMDGILSKKTLVDANKKVCRGLTVQKHMDWDMFQHKTNKAGEEIGFPHVNKETARRNSVLVCLPIKLKPKNRKGLGAPAKLYASRAWLAANPGAVDEYLASNERAFKATRKTPKAKTPKAKTPRKSKGLETAATSPVTVPVIDATSPETKAYEATKAELTAPVPVVDIAPAPETPAPETVAETVAVS